MVSRDVDIKERKERGDCEKKENLSSHGDRSVTRRGGHMIMRRQLWTVQSDFGEFLGSVKKNRLNQMSCSCSRRRIYWKMRESNVPVLKGIGAMATSQNG